MNTVDQAVKLVRNWRRHRAVLHPRTLQFLYHWMRGSTVLPYPPLKLHLEPTSVCNLRCPMCPQAIDAVKGNNGYIDLQVYRKIVDEAAGFAREINLFFRGEPLLHKSMAELLRYGRSKGARLHVNTNATILREKQSRMLIEDGASKVTISFDGPDKATYEQMRKGATYEKTLENVRQFLRLVKEYRSNGWRTPYTVMQVILPYDPQSPGPQVPRHMKELFAGLPVDEWDPIWPHGWAGVMQENGVVQAQPYGTNYHPCNWLWKSLAIYWDGRVASCCADFSGDQIIGDVKTQSLQEIWNGEAMVRLRRLQVEGRYKEASLCSGCDALWQKDSTAWSTFSSVERVVRPAHFPVGKRPQDAPAQGELLVSPTAAEVGTQGVAALAAAANGYTPPRQ
ncbi:MAG TPA: radical SAM/SPASM domain-containing protein [Chloroflexota bacterium]|nr:radical SAM/SPASM domain-containing protein [Chloroflexota bacterium]